MQHTFLFLTSKEIVSIFPYSKSYILISLVIQKMLQVNPEAARTPDNNGSYPIHHYASSSNADSPTLLLMIKCFADSLLCRNKHGNTPLSIAIASDALHDDSSGSDDVIMALIIANDKVAKIPNKDGFYPLHYVGRNANISIDAVKKLISLCPEALYKRNIYGATPIFLAVYWDAHIDIMRALLEAAPDAATIRDERGLCSISSAWNLFVRRTRCEDKEVQNQANRVLGNREIMARAETPFDLEGEVEVWWGKMELLLKASYHQSVSGLVPPRVWRTLHAVVGVNSPPNLARFAIKLYRNHVFLKDEEGRLPLHIAARNPIYVPQLFEPHKNNMPILVVLAHINPNGVKEKDNQGRIALHIALEAGKTWTEGISDLLHYSPQIIRERDSLSKLYPFMLAAVNFIPSSILHSRCECVAKSKVKSKDWRKTSQREKKVQIKEIMEKNELDRFNTIYELLRLDPFVLTRAVEGYSDDKEKAWLRQSNAKFKEQISEMKPASVKLKREIRLKRDLFKSEIEELERKLEMLQHESQIMSQKGLAPPMKRPIRS